MSSEQSSSASRPRLATGTIVRDTYTVVELLGSGRFADAYLVRHRFMGMQVMKLLVDGLEDSDRMEGLHEAFLLSRIAHPGIIRVFDANRIEGDLGGHPYITMEYASGGTLSEMLEECDGGLNLDAALDLGWQIANAIGHAHRIDGGVVHRDVKPDNILLEKSAANGLQVRLGDFGLAARVDHLLKVVGAGGTILYMSPESLRGFETPASDVFSAGLVLYEMLAGTLPYPRHALSDVRGAVDMQRRLAEIQASDLPSPSYFDRSIPPDVDSVVARSLHADIEFRFRDGVEFSHAIDACRHVRRDPTVVALLDLHRNEIKTVFSLAAEPETIAKAVVRLDSLLDENSELVRPYLPHLRQLRVQAHRYQESSS